MTLVFWEQELAGYFANMAGFSSWLFLFNFSELDYSNETIN